MKEEFMLFRAASRQVAVSLSSMKEVHRAAHLAVFTDEKDGKRRVRFPDSQVMPLYDMAEIFPGEYDVERQKNQKVMRLSCPPDDIAILVSDTERVIETDNIFQIPPAFKGKAGRLFPYLLAIDDILVAIIDPFGIKEIMEAEEE